MTDSNNSQNYFWVRIFDYKYDDELSQIAAGDWEKYKGVLLDEYYIFGEELTREGCKEEVKRRSGISLFAKKRKKEDCIYAIVMDSNKHWHDRFYKTIDTVCFGCGCEISGKEHLFWKFNKYNTGGATKEIDFDDFESLYFCSYDCAYGTYDKLNPRIEWQEREGYETNGGVFGYIYHIYNRRSDKHYIGQTVYMPFFRWQEHVKDKLKGDLCDLVFEVVTEVRVKNQDYLNDVEAWWIRKFIHEYGRENVMNMNVPRVKFSDMLELYERAIEGKIKKRMKNLADFNIGIEEAKQK